jgi:hypothetical protein
MISLRLALLFIWSLTLTAPLKATQLSSEAKISLITASPGYEMYQLFGHSALRVYDPINQIDDVYNWGTFDFDTPNFTWKFMRGRLMYALSVDPFFLFYPSYIQQERSLYETVLLLSEEEKQALYDYMEWNALQENRYYRYDFFFDNCATRIRDMVDSVVTGQIMWDQTGLPQEPSFRQLIDGYIGFNPYLDLGIDLLLGSPSDATAGPWGSMFLPDYLMQGFEEARIESNGETRSLSETTIVLYQANPPPAPQFAVGPWVISFFIFLVAAVLLLFEWRSGRKFPLFDGLLFGFIGLLGLFMCFMWFGTDHTVLPWNFNLLWCWPFHLFLLPWILKHRKPKWIKVYFKIYLLFQIICLIGFVAFPQELHTAILPLIMALALRSLSLSGVLPVRSEAVAPYPPQ